MFFTTQHIGCRLSHRSSRRRCFVLVFLWVSQSHKNIHVSSQVLSREGATAVVPDLSIYTLCAVSWCLSAALLLYVVAIYPGRP